MWPCDFQVTPANITTTIKKEIRMRPVAVITVTDSYDGKSSCVDGVSMDMGVFLEEKKARLAAGCSDLTPDLDL